MFRVVAVLAVISSALALQAGIETAITGGIVNKGFNHYAPVLCQKLSGQTFPVNETFKTNFSSLTLDGTITTVKVDSLSLPIDSFVVDLSKGGVGVINMHDQSLQLTVGYKMTANPGSISDYGDIVVTAGLDKFSLNTDIIVQSDGRVKVKINKMAGDLSKLDYKLDTHSWVIRMADAAAHGTIVAQIKNAVNKALNGMGGQIQADIDKFLATVDYEVQVGKTDMMVDTHILQLTTDVDLNLGLNGTAFKKDGSKSCPYTPVDLPDYASKADARVQFSSYLLNTIAYAGSDEVDLLLDQTKIPPQVNVTLNTDFFDTYFPGLKSTFGSAPVSIEFTIPDVPDFHIKDKLFKGNLNAAFTMKVQSANGDAKAFDCSGAMYNENNITFMRNDTGLYAHVTIPTLAMNTLKFENVHSGLNLDSETARGKINELFKQAMAQFNQKGSFYGFPLPDYVALESVDVIFKEEVLELAIATGLDALKFRDIFF